MTAKEYLSRYDSRQSGTAGGERMSQQHSKSCSGCLAEYQGECVAETCCGKLIQFPCRPINRPDSREWRKKAYKFAATEFESYFAGDYRDEGTDE